MVVCVPGPPLRCYCVEWRLFSLNFWSGPSNWRLLSTGSQSKKVDRVPAWLCVLCVRVACMQLSVWWLVSVCGFSFCVCVHVRLLVHMSGGYLVCLHFFLTPCIYDSTFLVSSADVHRVSTDFSKLPGDVVEGKAAGICPDVVPPPPFNFSVCCFPSLDSLHRDINSS